LFIYGLFCRPLSGTTSLPESGLMQLFSVGRCFIPLPFKCWSV